MYSKCTFFKKYSLFIINLNLTVLLYFIWQPYLNDQIPKPRLPAF